MISDERSDVSGGRKGHRGYEPDIRPRLQLLLATLAGLDVAHASSLLLIESGDLDNARKDQLIAELWQAHCRQRAPYVREIEALSERAEAAFH